MNEDRQRRNTARLEHKRQLINQRLDSQRDRINARFDAKQAELDGKLNLKQEQIIAAALELLSADGLSNITLREIAKRTNMQAPALYWYFKSKEDLVDFMAEAILQKEFKNLQQRQEHETWQNWLTNHMKQLRKAMLAYPDGARVVAGAHLYPAVTLGKSFECALVSLCSAGIELQAARHIVMTTTNYTFGYVIEEQAAPTAEQLLDVDWGMLTSLYPTMMKAIQEAGWDVRKNQDKEFSIGLEYIINGAVQA